MAASILLNMNCSFLQIYPQSIVYCNPFSLTEKKPIRKSLGDVRVLSQRRHLITLKTYTMNISKLRFFASHVLLKECLMDYTSKKVEKTNSQQNGGWNKSPATLAYVLPMALPFDVAAQRVLDLLLISQRHMEKHREKVGGVGEWMWALSIKRKKK